ncbi:MAG: major capsid protein, partial [Bacteroidota bacterium]
LIGTIRELRRATSLQHFFELAAQVGSRYIEQIFAYFGVRSSDSRMQRPEYLGGGATPLVISEILNTSATATEPQGNRSGNGMAAGGGHGFGFDGKYRKGYRAEEHGYIITVMYVLPKTAYQQGLHKMWTRDNRFDFAWPQFAHIGEQEVKDHEIYQNPADPIRQGTFGYQDRYAEYKYKGCSVHGDFRDDLDFWHMGRKFSDPGPSLNSFFVQSIPTQRIFAVEDNTDYLYAHVYHQMHARRPLPFFSNPRLM